MQVNIKQIPIPKNQLFNSLQYSQLTQIKVLYKNGNICDVKLVQYKNHKYALKIIEKSRIPQDLYSFQYKRIFNEITILYHLDHPNIIKLYWHQQSQSQIYMLFEFFGNKLWKFMKKKELSEIQIKKIVKQICQALNKIHLMGFVHRDISSDNILINEELDCKIIDFGYANEILGRRETILGTLQYIAPEIIRGQPYNHKADVWSLGILIYQLYHHKTPFSEGEQSDPDEISRNRSNLNYQINPTTPLKVQSLIKSILVLDPQYRPDVSQILSGSWLSNREEELEDLIKRPTQRRTYKIPINTNFNASKDMPIKQLENILFDLSIIHSKQLLRKKELIQQLLRTQQKLIKIRDHQHLKNQK